MSLRLRTWSVLAALGLAALQGGAVQAGSVSVLVGPAGYQNGGPGPLAIPPVNIAQYQVTYITDGGVESRLSVVPGLLCGYRLTDKSVYLGLGGGLILDANGAGLGPYMATGYMSGEGKAGTFHFNAEFLQAVGLAGHGQYVSPFTVQIGVIWR